LPPKHLANQAAFIAELKKACPEVIVRGGDPLYTDFRGDTLPKLIGKPLVFYYCKNEQPFN